MNHASTFAVALATLAMSAVTRVIAIQSSPPLISDFCDGHSYNVRLNPDGSNGQFAKTTTLISTWYAFRNVGSENCWSSPTDYLQFWCQVRHGCPPNDWVSAYAVRPLTSDWCDSNTYNVKLNPEYSGYHAVRRTEMQRVFEDYKSRSGENCWNKPEDPTQFWCQSKHQCPDDLYVSRWFF